MLVAGAACGGSDDAAEGPSCHAEADVIVWGGTQWVELGTAIADNTSKCTEYFISVPPQDADRTQLRGRAAFDQLRRLDPRIHPVAEIRFTGEAGWRSWVKGPHPDFARGRTFYEAGVEARRRMEQAGLDVENGETWALNELSPEVLEDAPGWRDDVLEFLRGLHEGAPGMPESRGIVFNIFVPSDTTDLSSYKESLKAWLEDEEFWTGLDKYVEFFAEEVYPSPLTWGVADASHETRTEYLNDYLFHMLALAEAGPDSVEAARTFLERTFVPLANAAWPHEGIGKTNVVSAQTMSAFIAAQVDAIRTYFEGDEREKIGFAWAPNAAEPGYTEERRDMIAGRLGSAILAAYHDEPGAEISACGSPDENTGCTADVQGASFNDAWKAFSSWD